MNRGLPKSNGLVIGSVGLLSKTFLQFLCRFKVYHQERLLNQLSLSQGPVITYANHISMMDDPLMWGSLPITLILSRTHEHIRWGLGASELLYRDPISSWFFSSGKVLPIHRGQGLDQPGMHQALLALRENQWLHLFVEGKIQTAPSAIQYPLKWGLAHLILRYYLETKQVPVVLPLILKGFDQILPLDTRLQVPRPWKRAALFYGEPIASLTPHLLEASYQDLAALPLPQRERRLRQGLSRLLYDSLARLHAQAYAFPPGPGW